MLVDAPSLETFQVRSDGALSNLIGLKMSLLSAGSWPVGLFMSQPKPFCESVSVRASGHLLEIKPVLGEV